VEGKEGQHKGSRRLRGMDRTGIVFEWYGESGGQLKYYPDVESAIWVSNSFKLEPLPRERLVQYSIINKAKDYFASRWTAMEGE
jgi:hypothetical protein